MKNMLIIVGVTGFLIACGGGGSSSGGSNSSSSSSSGGGSTTKGTYCALNKSSYTDSTKSTLVQANDPNCGTRCDGGTIVAFYRPTMAIGETNVNDTRCTTEIAGTYTGTLDYSQSTQYSQTAQSFTATDSITVVLNTAGKVTITFFASGNATGTLNGKMFTATLSGSSYNSAGFTCSGTITFKGNLSGKTITGTLGSTINCVHDSNPVNDYTITHNGTYSATM